MLREAHDKFSEISANVTNSYIQRFLHIIYPFLFLAYNLTRKLILYSHQLLKRILLYNIALISNRPLRDQPIIELLSRPIFALSLVIRYRCNITKWVKILLLPLVDTRVQFWPLATRRRILDLFFQLLKV